ncbi:MAG: hypothetical protein HN729_00680 [Candidatus Marinimicrobia bacterium]|jgi:hypothetical protein|nr:hypothetical protein [Candidatus Neomarinimicrobiota bacterium]MBT3633412.1 hypothetical protein [Candidatus Neomarinimicrobiota bacterium]MBT3681555.1 hypothetical protein [Candidatus Neomarinimicrobiota bacterium]MBT3758478.1 hypothetical protein [Candidatus Neomarinimicrobiota bacterium]MBT3894868.1 hypothetical protein [Candidatus Neomarinimicrobiota bacterium]
MRHFSIFISSIAMSAIIFTTDLPQDACVSCHFEIDQDKDVDERSLTNILDDIHIQKGLGCSDCHGGNPEAFDDEDEAMWDVDSFLGTIERVDQPQVCGVCHSDPIYMRQYSAHIKTDQVGQYWTSQHGVSLKEGNQNVAVCTDCHSVHGIFPVNDPRSSVYALNVPETCNHCHGDSEVMEGSGLSNDQYDKYRISVHGVALLDDMDISAPACNDCHGNHGAIPPSVFSISDICGSCHVNNKDLFKDSHLSDIFLNADLNQCEGCHNYHDILTPTDEDLLWNDKDNCVECHQEIEDVANKMGVKFNNIITELKSKIDLANEKVASAENMGMEVSDLFFDLEEAHKILIQTRTSIHSFNLEHVSETASSGYKSADAAILGAEKAMEEFDFRKTGLLIFSIILTMFAILLYLKIKSLEKNK